MSFKVRYENCLTKNNLKLLVIRQGAKDILLGYRLYVYNQFDDSQSVYDFAVDGDEVKSLPNGDDIFNFLTEITGSLPRIYMVSDGKGGFTTKSELSSKYKVAELKGRKIVEPLCQVIRSFVIAGKYDLKKCKNL